MSMHEEMACQVCTTPLNTLGDPPRYLHPLDQPGTGHEPVPVPSRTLPTVRRTCDFCSDPFPIWALTGATLVAGIVSGTHSGTGQMFGDRWATCATCELHIAAGRRDRILDRACRAFGLPRDQQARMPVQTLQSAFLAGLRPGRTLITTTGWPPTPLAAGQTPKVRDRLRDFYRGADQLPEPAG
ncbi:hypothetical protein AB0M20_44220, partial [Actinoplanes sp. NPDC051633]